MRNLAFLVFLGAVMGCHPKVATPSSQLGSDSALNFIDITEDTSTSEVITGPSDEEMAALEEREKQLAYKTEDPSYSEKALTSSQYVLDEENDDIALRWAAGKINNYSCAMYVLGIQSPENKSIKPDNLNKIITKMGKKHLLVLVNDKQVDIPGNLISAEILERMDPTAIGSFLFQDNPYLLIKFYTFSFTTSGSGYVNLLINVNTGKVWKIETPGDVLFKTIIDTIASK